MAIDFICSCEVSTTQQLFSSLPRSSGAKKKKRPGQKEFDSRSKQRCQWEIWKCQINAWIATWRGTITSIAWIEGYSESKSSSTIIDEQMPNVTGGDNQSLGIRGDKIEACHGYFLISCLWACIPGRSLCRLRQKENLSQEFSPAKFRITS